MRRIGYAAPYGADLTERGRAHLALHGFDVMGVARLEALSEAAWPSPRVLAVS